MIKLTPLFLLLALVALIAPVSAVAFPGCPESGAAVNCTVSVNTALTSNLNSVTFQYNSFTVNPGITISTPVSVDVLHNGGNITIIARQMNIGGTISSDAGQGNPSWTLNGGNGGFVTLITKENLFLGRTGALTARGANGAVSSCATGNGGIGGKVSLQTVPGAQVSLLGIINVTGGNGAILPSACSNATNVNGTNGAVGVFENTNFITSIVDFSITNTNPISLTSGNNATVLLNIIDQFGTQTIPASTAWVVSNSTVASITSSNTTQATITGLRIGTTTVNATIGSIQRSITVNNAAGEFDHITVNVTSNSSLIYGQAGLIEIKSYDINGNPVAIPQARFGEIQFTTPEVANQTEVAILSCLLTPPCNPNNGIYTVGVINGGYPGNILVRIKHKDAIFDVAFTVAMQEGDVVSIRLSPQSLVTQANSQTQFHLIGIDSNNFETEFQADSWAVVNGTGTGVINSNGVFIGFTPGNVTISGTLNSRTNITNATITLGSANFVYINGSTVATAGQAVVFNATLKDAAGNQLTTFNDQTPAFIWTTNSGTIYPNGILVPTRAGNVTITAKLVQNQAILGVLNIFVNAAEPTGLGIAESGRSVQAGIQEQLTAYLTDKFGNPVTETEATWTILNGTGQATLNGKTILPTKAGYVTLYAISTTNASLTATGMLTIVPGLPALIKIKPTSPSIRPGSTVSFTVDAFDAFGNKYSLNNVNWTVSNINIATISTTGLLTGIGTGSTTVTASINQLTIRDSVNVEVLEPLESQSQQLAAPLLGTIPTVTIPGEIARISVNTENLGNGLTGLFTLGEANLDVALIGALALLLIGLVAYYANTVRH